MKKHKITLWPILSVSGDNNDNNNNNLDKLNLTIPIHMIICDISQATTPHKQRDRHRLAHPPPPLPPPTNYLDLPNV